MGSPIKAILASSGVLKHVILPQEIDLLLSALEATSDPGDPDAEGIITGNVNLNPNISQKPIPGFDFALTLPTGSVESAPYKIKYTPASGPTSFQFWIQLADQGQARLLFKFVGGVPGLALTGAIKTVDADGTVSLKALPADDPKHTPILVSCSSGTGSALGPALLISGSATEPASIRFTPDTDSTQGVVAFGLEPSTVVFGSSNIGFDCPVLIIDDSIEAKAEGNGAPSIDPPKETIDADERSWRGILARRLDFYLPADVPLFGGQPINGYLEIGRDEAAKLVIDTKVPAHPATTEQNGRHGYSIRIECLDPTAKGLSCLLPTLISATMELPLNGAQASFKDELDTNQNITFAAGKPVLVTATFARDPVNTPDKLKIAIGIASQGQDGLVSVKSETMGGAKIFNTAAAMATTLIADKDIERKADVGDSKGVLLYTLVAAGTALSSLFENDSRFVLHGVEIESTGHGAPVGGPVVLTLDYSVAVRVTKIDIGALNVEMKREQPMRIRVRRVRMSVDPRKSGLSIIGLDFDHAEMEIENPGAWNVGGLESLFDVLGSRSGRGSSWIEVDLRFKLNLGPIKVSGATVRATLNSSGGIDASIRGLEAGLTIPSAIEGRGRLQLREGNGFDAALLAKLLPLNLNADAGVIYAPPMILLRLDVDLPAAIPLANSGFGLFGIGGMFGLSAEPDYEQPGIIPESDPVLRQLQWQPKDKNSFKEALGQSTFGLDAAVGTLPDLGFSFSAKAGLLITVPDVAVRGSLNGRLLRPVVKLSDPSYPPDWSISFLGFIGVDSEALNFGVLGSINLKPLLEIKVPLAGHFPFKETDDWYIYLGADGAPVQGRSIGPIMACVLPDILDVGADAYIMLRGKGIEAWPHGRALPGGPLTLREGFVLAFGFSLQSIFGVKPIVWAELYASLDLMIGAKPPTLAGFGRAGGSLNLGPFSLGVEAQVYFIVRENEQYFWTEVTGRIELLFFDIEGKVTIAFGNEPKLTLPDPDLHPLDRLNAAGVREGSLGVLTDDSYRVLAHLVENPTQITDDMRVWPDAMVSLPFAIPPEIKKPDAGAQFPGVVGPDATPPPSKIGSEMLYYKWRLDKLELVDVTNEADPMTGTGTRPEGQLAARWQVPRGSTGGGDISELVLFSTSPDLWVNRLADGGEGLPGKPLQQAADICNRQVMPEAGWAIGLLADQESAGFRLPPELVSQNPLVSRVEARMHHFGVTPNWKLIPLDEVFTLPQPFSLDVASLIAWPQPEEIKHEFLGYIIAPNLRWLTGLDIDELIHRESPFACQQINLDLSELITEGLLVLVADRELFNISEDFFGLRIFDDLGHEWINPDLLSVPTGETAGLYQAPTTAPVSQLRITYPLGTQLGVVGIGGITISASAAALAENKAIQDEIARLVDAAAAGPKTDPTTNFPHQRAILEPGRLYRLDIDMVWSGEMFKQDEKGNVIPVKGGSKADQKFYTPKGSTKQEPTKRSLFFKTTPKPEAHVVVPYGKSECSIPYEISYISWLFKKQDVFQPEMIERYLSGYEPNQSEEFRFCDDPLRAHFRHDHVQALAKAYGFTILVDVQRVDRPGPAYAEPLVMAPEWSFATNPIYLSNVDQLRYGYSVASNCDVPTLGSTATIKPPLEPEAWYDLHLLAKADNDRAFLDGRLPGVTFRTSRWRTPQEMFSGLGFTTVSESTAAVMAGSPAVIVGDLVIVQPAALGPAVTEDDDQAFQNALLALGIEGWPVTDVLRLSRLWIPGTSEGWLFAGLMVESPEPIHRPGRVELNSLTLDMGNAGSAIRFDIRRRDRSGSRLIYLTATPFTVVTRESITDGRWPFLPHFEDRHQPQYRMITPQLVLKAKANLDKVSTNISGFLVIPPVPSFSEDP